MLLRILLPCVLLAACYGAGYTHAMDAQALADIDLKETCNVPDTISR